jgi:Ca-activated chloride channel homolog
MLSRIEFRYSCFVLFVLCFLANITGVKGQGFLVPDTDQHWRLPRPFPPHPHPPVQPPPGPPQLYRTKQVDIDARIVNSVAHVQLSQTFVNESSQTVEARCVMPVPYEAVLQNLTFLVDGKEIEGKLMSAEEARRIYQGYVQRSKDPALVQWLGSGLIQTNVFPIPPQKERTVTLSFTQVVSRTNGMLDWQMPLRAAGYSSQPLEKININVYLEDDQSLGNIYSPSHSVDIVRSGTRQVTIRYTSKSEVPVSNFRVLADTTKKQLAANWIGYRPDSEEPGYFLMLLHPTFEASVDDTPKNIVLCLDKSGSMRGDKIEQARNALIYVLDHLPKKDRVGIVVYDSQVMTFRDKLISASDEREMESARTFVRTLGASGSTNIDQGLQVSLKMLDDSDGPSYIVHLSDGVATVGERDERQITANAVKLNTERTRVFNFGVGHDVNSKLMNRLSQECFGQTFFVEPEQDIEEAVSALYDRLGQPSLTDVRWEIVSEEGKDRGKLVDVYPSHLPDLFSGDQTSIVGRFRGSQEATLIVTGKIGSKSVKYEQTLDLGDAKSRADSRFIATLWASRRAAAIIDEMDLEGRKESLMQELLELAKKYGILTPYTAFLAEEPDANMPLARQEELLERRLSSLELQSGQQAFRQRRNTTDLGKASNAAEADRLQSFGAGGSADAGLADLSASTATPPAPTSGSGRPGLGGGGLGGRAPLTGPAPVAKNPIRRSGEHAYFLRDGKWVDSRLGEKIPDKVTKVERFSDEYFKLLEKYSDALGSIVDVDEPIVVKLGDSVYEI